MAEGSDFGSSDGEFEDSFRAGNSHDDDKEFDFDDSYGGPRDGAPSGGGQPAGAGKPTTVKDQPYDEAFDVSDGGSFDDVPTPDKSPNRPSGMNPESQEQPAGRGDSPPGGNFSEDEESYNPGTDEDKGMDPSGGDEYGGQDDTGFQESPKDHSGTSSEGEDSGDDQEEDHVKVDGEYNPQDFESLEAPQDVKDLFHYITKYKPSSVSLETHLRPFIPDFIPSVGDIDAFIKVPRPDGKPDQLGLTVLDEPSANQSDPTVLDLQLRAISKKPHLQPMVVRSIDGADKKPKEIKSWIDNIADLRKNNPRPTVNYSKNMPDLEPLLQVWPTEFEALLDNIEFPSGDIDLDLKTYSQVVCALFDIPTYENVTESLHLLFTLYSEFRQNQHFNQQTGVPEGAPPLEGDMGASMSMGEGGQSQSIQFE